MQLFRADKDDDAFGRVVEETLRVAPMPIGADGRLPNHCHFVVRPERAGDLSRFMQRITTMHTQRWPSCDTSNETLCGRIWYGERRRGHGPSLSRRSGAKRRLLADWPLPRPADCVEIVNQAQSELELAALRRYVNRGSPHGDAPWVANTARALGVESTLRARERPRQKR
ncbi:MAG TPA: hypothetical protein ENN80_14880 [Candidatus Hydrogenedentes bacterium]|nr:hypothetical protein [Candidatus Hydrogenedentota bacterium]